MTGTISLPRPGQTARMAEIAGPRWQRDPIRCFGCGELGAGVAVRGVESIPGIAEGPLHRGQKKNPATWWGSYDPENHDTPGVDECRTYWQDTKQGEELRETITAPIAANEETGQKGYRPNVGALVANVRGGLLRGWLLVDKVKEPYEATQAKPAGEPVPLHLLSGPSCRRSLGAGVFRHGKENSAARRRG